MASPRRPAAARCATACSRPAPTTPTTLARALRPASASIAPNTAPAPPMSHFMSSMPCAGLIEMPPVSKHTPLPTRASGCLAAAALPAHAPLRRAAAALPWATPSSALMPSRVSSSRPGSRPRPRPRPAGAGVGERPRRQDVAGLGHEVARPADRRRQATGARHRGVRIIDRHPQAFGPALVLVLGVGRPVLREPVGAQHHPQRQRCRHLGRRECRLSPSDEIRTASPTLSARSFCASDAPASSSSSRLHPRPCPVAAAGCGRAVARGQEQIQRTAVLEATLRLFQRPSDQARPSPVEPVGRVAQRSVMADRDDRGAPFGQARWLEHDLHPRPPLNGPAAIGAEMGVGPYPNIPAPGRAGLSTLRRRHGRLAAR